MRKSTKSSSFFSVIVPTYNPGDFLPRLLGSIKNNKCAKQIDVIISDDCSTEDLSETIKQFPDMNIKMIKNDHHYGFPRMGRQNGTYHVKTPWFCFADQDDYFLDNAFDDLMTFIKEKKAKNYIVSDFILYDVNLKEEKIMTKEKDWTHGKIYEKAFWTKYNIEYPEVHYCEDIALTTLMRCVCIEENIEPVEYDKPIYVWCRRSDSLADFEYFKKSLPDTIKSTFKIYLEYAEKYKDDNEKANKYLFGCIVSFIHFYFNVQSFLIWDEKMIQHESIIILQPLFTRFKKLTGFSNNDFLMVVHNDLRNEYQIARNADFEQIPFIEQISFKDWVGLNFE